MDIDPALAARARFEPVEVAREQWREAEPDLRHGGVLIVRWLGRVSHRYDALHRTMRRLKDLCVLVEWTLNGMVFDGKPTDLVEKSSARRRAGVQDRLVGSERKATSNGHWTHF